jgi:hypothetical protein
MPLNFGQRNAIQSALRECALQIESLLSLLDHPRPTPHLVPLSDLPADVEKQKIVRLLSQVQTEINSLCSAFGISVEPTFVHKSIHHRASYLWATVSNILPHNLAGYGPLDEHDRKLLEVNSTRIISLLKELSECSQ